MQLIQDRKLDNQSFVLELAGNDGYLLRNYLDYGIPCLGIDPAEGPAAAAEKNGVPTLVEFFTPELARKIRTDRGPVDVIHANNVLAHVADTNGFVEGMAILLKDSGVAVIEVPYVKDLIEHCEFDTIYREHLCYFSVTALKNLFQQHALFLQDVKHIPIHRSLRIYVGHGENMEKSVASLLEQEKRKGWISCYIIRILPDKSNN